MTKPIVVKTTVNLPKETLEAAKALAAERNASVSDVIKAALDFDAFVTQATKTGEKLLLETPDKTLRQLVLLR
jgi:Arc/MetJ-type ribon-helix-helix transcriptional regulator